MKRGGWPPLFCNLLATCWPGVCLDKQVWAELLYRLRLPAILSRD